MSVAGFDSRRPKKFSAGEKFSEKVLGEFQNSDAEDI
jgi:hypothetical protein